MSRWSGNGESDRDEPDEFLALFTLLATSVYYFAWFVWFLSSVYMLPIAVVAWATGVTDREAVAVGALHATWVAGVPLALLALGHAWTSGWTKPAWQLRWILVAVCIVLWCVTFAWWLAAPAGYESR